MEYVKYELERLIGGGIDVRPLFDFIHQFTEEALQAPHQHVSAERRHEIIQFESHWREVFPPCLRDCILAHIVGCWLPKVCRDAEIGNQVQWSIFIGRYLYKRVMPTYESSDQPKNEYVPYTPLNWDDLVQISFWEEMYTLFGHNLVRFIFEKCLILLPIEESFVLAICHKSSIFNKKIDDGFKPDYFRKIPTLRRRLVSIGQTVPERVHKNNPYDIPCPNDVRKGKPKNAKKVKVPPGQVHSQLGRKRKRKFVEVEKADEQNGVSVDDIFCTSSSKKHRLDSNVGRPSMEQQTNTAVPSIHSGPPSNGNVQSVQTPKTNKYPRWITPTASVLQQIRQARDALKQMRKRNPSTKTKKNTAPTCEYTFVNIMKDKYFAGKLNVITKETHSVGKEKLPTNLAGLVLPKVILANDKPTEITVHRLSETAARQFKLRINPRKRRHRKKPKHIESVSLFSRSDGISEIFSGGSGGARDQAGQGQRTSPGIASLFTSEKPFNPAITLITSSIVHFQSSGNKWPDFCDMGKATSTSKSQELCVSSLLHKMVHFSIICPRDKDKWENSVQYLENVGKLSKLQENLNEMVQFHRRAKDLTKLMKNCIWFWFGKLSIKEELREERKLANELSKTNRRNQRVQRKKAKKRIEIIDLTVDTPSTGSTNVGSQPHNISAVTVHSGSGGQRDTSGLAGAHPSFLSTTPNRSHSQRERQKLAFAKLKDSIPPSCILSAISQILFLSGGHKLLGSNSNRKGFLAFIRKSIFLAGMKSAIHLGQLVAMVDPNKCPWLADIHDLGMKYHLLAKVLYWLFNQYILMMLRTCFYTTESSNSRFQLGFYLRDTWRSVSDRLKYQFTKRGSLTKVRRNEAEYKKPANGRMRLIPKQNLHIRPILSFDKSVNEQINVPHCITLLNYICGNLAPHGVRDASSLRQKWKLFLRSWERRKFRPLYYIRLDIRDAYPSVKIEKLKEILVETCSTNDDLKAKKFLFVGRKSRFQTKVSIANFSNPNSIWHSSIFNRPCIVKDMDKDLCFNNEKEKIVQKLIKALTSNVVQIGKHKFTFSHGLPQGWCLSQALCNIYYGHMDKKYFSNFLNNENEFFVRSVDDYFYVSSNPGRIASFFHKMKCGIPDYNCNINPDKSMTNIFIHSNLPIPSTDCEWVRYCGWRFCLASGHIARDFSSYAGADFCSTLSFMLNKAQNPEEFIYRRMGMVAPVRLKYLVLDPAINCRDRILMTTYEAGLVMAFRFYAMCRVLFRNLTSVADPVQGDYLIQAINRCTVSLIRLVKRNYSHFYAEDNLASHRCHLNLNIQNGSTNWSVVPQSTPARNNKAPANSSSIPFQCRDAITDLEISFVIYYAFRQKLLVHANNFNQIILPKLEKKMRMLKKMLTNRAHYFYLIGIIGKTMPSHFRDIKI